MCDIFLSEDVRRILEGKKVVFIGDSNIRSYYKDLLCLFHQSAFISKKDLIAKMEQSIFGDNLTKHGEKNNSRQYTEERVFNNGSHNFEFYFVTRVYNPYMERILHKITAEKQPDVVIINSCMWDLCRWGPKGVEEFKVNLVKLMKQFRALLKDDCLVIWATAPPLAGKPYGGFLLVELDFVKYTLRFHVMEANNYARKVVEKFGFDVLDIHYHLRMQTHRRCPDGIHWSSLVVRYITNLFLTHMCLAWDVDLPKRHEPNIAEKALQAEKMYSEGEIEDVVVETVDVICVSDSPEPSKESKSKNAAFKKKRRNMRKRQRLSAVQPYTRPRPPLLTAVPNRSSHCPPHRYSPTEYHAQPESLYYLNESQYAVSNPWGHPPESHYDPPNPWGHPPESHYDPPNHWESRYTISSTWDGSQQSRCAPPSVCYNSPRFHEPPSSCFARLESRYAPPIAPYDPSESPNTRRCILACPTETRYDPSESLNSRRCIVACSAETSPYAVLESQHMILGEQLYAASLDHNPSFWQNNLPRDCLF